MKELGYRDYLGALQRYRIEHPTDIRLLGMSSYLVDYPFADRLYPGALEVLNRLRSWGQTVILSDGDVVFQPRKVERSGISGAVRRLIYIHKEQALADVESSLQRLIAHCRRVSRDQSEGINFRFTSVGSCLSTAGLTIRHHNVFMSIVHDSLLYSRVEAVLASEIADGNLKVGDQLPTEDSLIVRFGVSRITVLNPSTTKFRHHGFSQLRKAAKRVSVLYATLWVVWPRTLTTHFTNSSYSRYLAVIQQP